MLSPGYIEHGCRTSQLKAPLYDINLTAVHHMTMNWIMQLLSASLLMFWSWTGPTYGEKALVESQKYEDGSLGPSPTQQFAASNFTP
jgi:hypothetical protein